MGVNISVASPLPDDITLRNFNGSWEVIRAWRKVWDFTLPAPLASATSIALTDLTARPTISLDKEYLLRIKKMTLDGASNISHFVMFGASVVAITPIVAGNLAVGNIVPTYAKISKNNQSTLVQNISFNDNQNIFINGFQNTENSIRFTLSTARILSEFEVELYERNQV